MSIRDKIREGKERASNFYGTVNDSTTFYNLQRYYRLVMAEKNCTYEEAVKLCETDPEFSLGLKLADPANVLMCCRKKGKEKFRNTLTDEEREIFDKDKNKNFLRQIRKGARA